MMRLLCHLSGCFWRRTGTVRTCRVCQARQFLRYDYDSGSPYWQGSTGNKAATFNHLTQR
jgi:hypothetical protein